MTPHTQSTGELRAAVIDAVCFNPGVTGHIEQFERIEALIRTEAYRLAIAELDRLAVTDEDNIVVCYFDRDGNCKNDVPLHERTDELRAALKDGGKHE